MFSILWYLDVISGTAAAICNHESRVEKWKRTRFLDAAAESLTNPGVYLAFELPVIWDNKLF